MTVPQAFGAGMISGVVLAIALFLLWVWFVTRPIPSLEDFE